MTMVCPAGTERAFWRAMKVTSKCRKMPEYSHFLYLNNFYLNARFTNVSLPDDFEKLLSTMRSREISVSILLQNLSQLKALFEKTWESIVGNCDEFLYLGGNEQSTHEYVSKLIGKETIDTNTYGRSRGRSGSYSTNYQTSARELLMPDEVRRLDNRYAIVFIRGERPVVDDKYDIMKHPNLALSADGGGKTYLHGEDTRSVASFRKTSADEKTAQEIPAQDRDFLIFTEEEMDEMILKKTEELKLESEKQKKPGT